MNRFKTFWSRFRKGPTYARFNGMKDDSQDVRTVVIDVVKFVALYHLAASYVINFTLCVGPSMMPTLEEGGSVVLIDLLSYKLLGRKYEKGDVVISICPTNPSKHVCKRILAVEGERVVTTRGKGFFQEVVRTVVPPGHVWLAGDNVENSNDSRSYGPVPLGLLQGRVFLKLGPSFIPPFTRIGQEILRPSPKSPAPEKTQERETQQAHSSKAPISGDNGSSIDSTVPPAKILSEQTAIDSQGSKSHQPPSWDPALLQDEGNTVGNLAVEKQRSMEKEATQPQGLAASAVSEVKKDSA